MDIRIRDQRRPPTTASNPEIALRMVAVLNGAITYTTPSALPAKLALKVVTIDGKAADVPARARGDVDRIKQIAINLLGNAIKFTERGCIAVHVSRVESTPGHVTLRFAVTDTGVGIRAEGQSKLFGMFSQVDGSLTRKYGGTGLGLAICKRIAEATGGENGVLREPGKGSTFWFTARLGHAERGASANTITPSCRSSACARSS